MLVIQNETTVVAMFIDNLFTAAKIYFESKNISMFNLDDFVKIVRFVASSREVSSSDVYKSLSSQLRCSERDVSGYLSLGWHLGVFAARLASDSKGRPRFRYLATRFARTISELCKDAYSRECIEVLRKLFLSWEPLRVLLRFVRFRGRFDPKEVVNVLGEEMRFWSSKMIQLGLPVKRGKSGAPMKPFNDYVVRKLFRPLIDTLQLYDTVPEERRYMVVKSRWGEPVIAAGIAHIVMSSQESVLVTPFIDEYGTDFLVRALYLSAKPRYVLLVVRKPHRADFAKLQAIAREKSIDIEVCIARRPLHAKIYASESEVLITSANLLKTSLVRNVEIGIAIKGSSHEVESVVHDLISS